MASTSLELGRGSFRSLLKKASALQARARNAREATEKTVGQLVRSTETVGGAFGMGLVQGRFPSQREVMGVPLELATGIALHGAAFLGLAGRSSDHLHAFADGALAAYAVKAGQDLGKKWAGKAGVHGYLDETSGDTLTEDELADLNE